MRSQQYKGRPKLDDSTIKKIKQMVLSGANTWEITKKCHVSVSTVVKHTKQERMQYAEQNPKYQLMAPDGQIYKFKCVADFCREKHLNYRNITKLLALEINQHKGWRLPQ